MIWQGGTTWGGLDQVCCYRLKIEVPVLSLPLPPKLRRGGNSNDGVNPIALMTVNFGGGNDLAWWSDVGGIGPDSLLLFEKQNPCAIGIITAKALQDWQFK